MMSAIAATRWAAHPAFVTLIVLLVFAPLVMLVVVMRAYRRVAGAEHRAADDLGTRVQAEDQLMRQVEQNVRLRELSTALSKAVSQPDVAKVMSEYGARAAGSIIANIAVRHPDTSRIAMVVSPVLGTEVAQAWATLDLADHTPITDAIRNGQAVLMYSAADVAERYPLLSAHGERAGISATASIPILDSDGAVAGAVGFGWAQPQPFDTEQLVILETSAELCAQAMERARLYDLEHEARRLAENLQAFATALANTETRADVADAMVFESMRVLGADAATLSVMADDGTFRILAGRGFDDDTMALWRSFPSTVATPALDALKTRQMIVLEFREQVIAAYPNLHADLERSGDEAWVALPLLVGREAAAVLFAVFRSPRSFSGQDRSLMATMAGQAAQAFDRARLREADLVDAEQARQLAAAIGGLTAADTQAAVSEAFIDALPALGAHAGVLGLISEDETTVDLADAVGYTAELVEQWRSRPIDSKSPLITATRTGVAEFINRGSEMAERFDASMGAVLTDLHRSWVALPLRAGGRTLGALGLSFTTIQPFDDEQRVTLASFAALCANALTRAARYELEHSIAITLQSSLLPSRLKAMPGVELSAQYSPGTRELTVGGDWYDVIDLADDRFLLVVGDVVGHGVESAAAMGKLATATRALAQMEQAPAALLQQLDQLAATDPTTQFASMAIVLVDQRAGELRYSLAGHPSPLLRRADGSIVILDGARSVALGGLSVDRPEHTVGFDGVVTVLLYTDGLTERRSDHIDDRLALLQSTLQDSADVELQALPRVLIAAMMTGGEQYDDMALLCARITRIVPIYSRTVPARPGELSGLRRELRGWLQTAGVGGDDTDDILVAVGEALTNAIEHGHDSDGGPIDMRAEYQGGRHVFTIGDHGTWKAPVDSDGARGRGLTMMGQLMDEVEITQRDSGTLVTLTKFVEQETARGI